MTDVGADQVWKSKELARSFLEGARRAVPLAAEQLELVLWLVAAWQPGLTSFLDLGCGDGILGRAILATYPQAEGVFLDFSGYMLAEARRKCPAGSRVSFVEADFGRPDWFEALEAGRVFDLVLSGFAIHHQPDERKQALYGEIYHRLRPGGLFLNLEHVRSNTAAVERLFNEYFIDSLYRFSRQTGKDRSRAQIASSHYSRPDAEANILAPVEIQCHWLRAAGFADVDCFFKIFELALFGGRKPF